jgi:hypothetical protein
MQGRPPHPPPVCAHAVGPWRVVQVYHVPEATNQAANRAQLPTQKRDWMPPALKTQMAFLARIDGDVTCGCEPRLLCVLVRGTLTKSTYPDCYDAFRAFYNRRTFIIGFG